MQAIRDRIVLLGRRVDRMVPRLNSESDKRVLMQYYQELKEWDCVNMNEVPVPHDISQMHCIVEKGTRTPVSRLGLQNPEFKHASADRQAWLDVVKNPRDYFTKVYRADVLKEINALIEPHIMSVDVMDRVRRALE